MLTHRVFWCRQEKRSVVPMLRAFHLSRLGWSSRAMANDQVKELDCERTSVEYRSRPRNNVEIFSVALSEGEWILKVTNITRNVMGSLIRSPCYSTLELMRSNYGKSDIKKWTKIAYIVVTNSTVGTQDEGRFPFDQNFRKHKVGSEWNRCFQNFHLKLARSA